jgi:hypothetical protein
LTDYRVTVISSGIECEAAKIQALAAEFVKLKLLILMCGYYEQESVHEVREYS